MKKLAVFLMTGILAGISFIGCDMLNPTDEDEVTITLTTFSSIEGGSYEPVTAVIDANVEITSVSVSVTKDGEAVTSGVTIEKQNMPTGEEKIEVKESGGDMKIEVKVAADACEGDYVFTISAKAGSAEVSKTNDFTVTNAKDCSVPEGTPVETMTLEAGANKNSSLGSSIDLDGGDVWKMADAANHVSEIDICYSHTASNGDKVGSPTWAKASNYDYAKNWDNPPETEMHAVSISSTTFDGIATVEEIEDLWESSSAAVSLTVEEDDIFIVKTTEGEYALVRITEQTAGETGSITIKVAIKE